LKIKEKLVHHHDVDIIVGDRHLTWMHVDNVVFFKLDGHPPLGYGIFIKERKLLILYTTRGRPFEEIEIDLEDCPGEAACPKLKEKTCTQKTRSSISGSGYTASQ